MLVASSLVSLELTFSTSSLFYISIFSFYYLIFEISKIIFSLKYVIFLNLVVDGIMKNNFN